MMVGARSAADQELRRSLRWASWRRREADALESPAGEVLQPLERQRQVAPPLSRATAWISSTITVRTPRSISRARSEVENQIERFGRGDEDMGGRRTISWRCAPGVSPVRTSVRISNIRQAQRFEHAADLGERALPGSSERRSRVP